MSDETTTAPVQTPAQTVDLDTLVQSDTGTLAIKHPVTGEPLGITVTIAGPEHAGRKALVFGRMRTARKEFQATGAITALDPEDEEIDETDLLARCTLGWQRVVIGGQTVAFSVDAARALYADPRRRWLRNQVKAGLDNLELFIGSSAQP